METHNVITTWKGNMLFDSVINGHHIPIDLMPEAGGENRGPSPKRLLLSALAGCTGMDVVAILRKMKIEVKSFSMNIEANVTAEMPRYYDKIRIIYEFTGNNLPEERLKRAVSLSQEQYCAVSFMLKKAAEITYEIKVNGIII